MLTAQQIIDHFGLVPLPDEGGMWGQSYRSSEILPNTGIMSRYGEVKPFGTGIFYLLTSDEKSFSAMHMLPTDEIFHFYLGDPVEMLNVRGNMEEVVILGQDILNGQKIVHTVERHTWQGCRLLAGGQWALMGTTMAPGFTGGDFRLGQRAELIRYYPRQEELITALTPE